VNRNFRLLWASVGVNSFGSALTNVALPLIALFSAGASAFELGALISIEQVAWLVFGLIAGVWVDRWTRRAVVVSTNLARAILIGLIPLALWTDQLQLWMLFAIGLLVGVCQVFGDVAHSAIVPEIVDQAGLVGANARINLTDTASGLSGSAVVGPIVALLGAPVALVIDAISFLLSAVLLRGVRVKQAAPPERAEFRREVTEGLAFVARDPLFRTITLGSMAFNACTAAQYVLGFVFLRDLHTPKAWFGILIAAGGVGALLGSAAVPALVRRWPDATVWHFGLVAGPAIGVVVPLAHPGLGLLPYALGTFGLGAAVAVTSIIGFSARQALCPPGMLGRVSATTRVATWGIIPVAAIAGGWLAGMIGVRATLWVIAGLYFAEPLIIRCSRIWHWATFVPNAESAIDQPV
jgi:Na+/melibiose symporter-like transporter